MPNNGKSISVEFTRRGLLLFYLGGHGDICLDHFMCWRSEREAPEQTYSLTHPSEPGIANGKKRRKFLGESGGILHFTTNISFVPSICIHRSIILIFIEKSMLVNFFPRKIYFATIFNFHFRENPRFHDKFQALSKVWQDWFSWF